MKKTLINKSIYFFFIILLIFNLNYLKNKSGFNIEILKNAFNKEWIPIYSIHRSDVLEAKKILIKNKISSFNLSDGVKKNELYVLNSSNKYFFYRTITHSYPILFNDNSHYTIFKSSEDIPSFCEIIDSSQYIKLGNCQ